MSRGNFPKLPRGSAPETPAQRRSRYEQWLIDTAAQAKSPDHELHAVQFYRGKTRQVRVAPGSPELKTAPTPPSRRLCITARCWQCSAGPDESNAQAAIAGCYNTRCGLHPVRPYQEGGGSQPAGARKASIRAYCLDCARGNSNEVRLCHAVSCAIWPIRPFQAANPDTGGVDGEGAGSEGEE